MRERAVKGKTGAGVEEALLGVESRVSGLIPGGESGLKTTFVLVDLENVQPRNLGALSGGSFKIKVFVGASQTKVPLEMAGALQSFGADAEYIQTDGNGKNALDFYIAYYIGRLAAENPGASFRVISKDSGFDPLIRHLRAGGVSCERSDSGSGTGAIENPTARSKPESIDSIIDNLVKRKAAKPQTLKTLRSTIKSQSKGKLSDVELDGLIGQLTKRGVIKVLEGKLHYDLPS